MRMLYEDATRKLLPWNLRLHIWQYALHAGLGQRSRTDAASQPPSSFTFINTCERLYSNISKNPLEQFLRNFLVTCR